MPTFRVTMSPRGSPPLVVEMFDDEAKARTYFERLTNGGMEMESLIARFSDGVVFDMEELVRGTWVTVTRRFGVPG